uniref:Uncharacterized protein n=1 Tax=Chromera velia CCMP2878 TaxID=1169474 RepID=A0A0G4I230_9ALVE|eukprot:Cvel_10228.t1-p1 / transcript=Cvel_10228.t1 / gene=Cvel_10228 / organism=Chromera_velia_CCMP2878 / gene_product=hypothetical protein / transcript_product=hypothetical protein / location=Cvel_scaffold612:71127-71516(+) / protein_length=130 / sequence_SO=supercontig / SO=protein_coding / is_pseudo=false
MGKEEVARGTQASPQNPGRKGQILEMPWVATEIWIETSFEWSACVEEVEVHSYTRPSCGCSPHIEDTDSVSPCSPTPSVESMGIGVEVFLKVASQYHTIPWEPVLWDQSPDSDQTGALATNGFDGANWPA